MILPTRPKLNILSVATLALIASLLRVSPTLAAVENVCYLVSDAGGSNGGNDFLVKLNTDTKQFFRVSLGTGTNNIEAAAAQPNTNILFAANQEGSNGRLGTIDLITGIFKPFPNVMGGGNGIRNGKSVSVTFADPDGLAFDPTDGSLYASIRTGDGSAPPDILIKVDPTTGRHIPNAFGSGRDFVEIQPQQNKNDIDGIAIGLDGTMYGIANQGSGGNQNLVIINKTNGTTTGTKTIKEGGTNVGDVEDLSFDMNGQLYISTGSGGNKPNRLYDLNPSTAAATNPRPITIGGDYEASGCFLLPPADVSLNKTVDNSSPIVGDTVNFSLTLTNDAAASDDPYSDANNIVVEDVLPAELEFDSLVTTPTGTTASYEPATRTLTWSVNEVLKGDNTVLQFKASATTPGSVTNTAEVTALREFDVDSVPNNNDDSEDDRESVTLAIAALDYGDAPDTYGTDNTASNSSNSSDPVGANHTIVSGLFLGATAPDADANGFVDGTDDNGNATDDDDPSGSTGNGDDEDNFTLPTLNSGDTSYTIPADNITVTNTTGKAATLHGWIDFDNSGTFDTEEYASVAVNDATNSGNPAADLTWNGINVGEAGNTYARFRLTTDSSINNATPGGNASDGEVEDYQIAIAPSTPAATLTCPTGSSSTGSGYATSGSGQYKNDIFWLDWSCGSTTQFNPGDVVQKTWTGFHGIEITATLSNITSAVEPYNTGQWRGDRLDELYGGVNPIGLSNFTNGEDPTYDITFSMTLNGVPIPADIVTAEAEDTNNNNESATWTTDGTPWQPLEAAPNSSLEVEFSNGGQTLTIEDRADTVDDGGVVIALTENVSTISTQMFAGGKEAIAFGIMTPFDFGDADGYPTSGGHLARRTAIGGSQPTTSTPVNNLTMATLPNNSPYLGSIGPDIDWAETSDIATVNADGDDLNRLDDEDGVTLPTLSQGDTSYTIATNDITANTTGVATLHAWVDFNKNSDFEPGEYQSVEVNNGNPAGDLTWNNLSGITSGTTYARFRITTDSNIDNTTPYASAINGEMEDYQVAIADDRNRPSGLSFTCDSTFYITIGDGGNNPPAPQFLYAVNRSGSTYDFVQIGSGTSEADGYTNSFRYNALAYNPVDNYLYAIVQVDNTNDPTDPYSVNNIVKIGSDGVLHSIGIPEDANGNLLPTTGYYAASILSDGSYIIGRGNQFAKINLETSPPTIISTGSISNASFTDFAVDPTDPTSLSGARVYGINESGNNRLVILDLATDEPKIISQATNPTGFNHNAGSQFVDSFGTLYYRSNSDQKLYRVDSDPDSDTYGVATEITTAPEGGNHDGASCLFASVMEKEVQDLDGNIITTIPAGETVNYVYSIASGNVENLTGVTFTDDLTNVASGDPIDSTFTGNFNISNGSGTVNFSNNNQAIEINDLTIPAQTGGRPGESLTITAEVKVSRSLAPGDYYNQAFISNLPAIYPSVISSDYPASASYEDPTPLSVTEPLDPNLLLVKRITAINPGQSDEIQFNSFVDDATTDNPSEDDNDPNWPPNDDTYLAGAIEIDQNNTVVKPGDEIEYTIYFLSNGDEEARNVKICDVIPDNMSFVPNSYDANSGIALLNSSADGATPTNLSNAADPPEEGTFYAPGTPPPTVGDPAVNLCRKVDSEGNIISVGAAENINGAVVVEINDSLPQATDAGEPPNSYGFIRFRAKVK